MSKNKTILKGVAKLTNNLNRTLFMQKKKKKVDKQKLLQISYICKKRQIKIIT